MIQLYPSKFKDTFEIKESIFKIISENIFKYLKKTEDEILACYIKFNNNITVKDTLDKPYLFTEVNQNTAPRQPVIVPQTELQKFQELEVEPDAPVTENTDENEETQLAENTQEEIDEIKAIVKAEIFGENEDLGDLVLDTLVTALAKDDGGITAQLLGKSFIGDLNRGVFGGVYYFENSESVTTYLDSELWKGVVAHPNLVDFKTDVFKTFNGTGLANGVHSSRKTSSDPADTENLHILVVNYTYTEAPTDEEMSSQVKEFAPVFSNENFPGMIGKTMINNTEDKVYGGVYYFTSRDAIENYFQSDLWKGFEGDENTDVYKKDIYGVASISTISNGVPVLD